MPKYVAIKAFEALCMGGKNIKLWQWNEIIDMIQTQKIGVKNAGKLIYEMMLCKSE